MHARRLRLHDRENVKVGCLYGRNRVAGYKLDPASGDRIDPVPARFANRCFGKIKHVVGHNGLADHRCLAGFKQDLRGTAISDALRARRPMVSSVGASGIEPAADTAP